ncbi:TerB family tellurite resistance protein [Pseudooceanicola sp. LIPI14-2-Ac024]|uniref:TerB family tellurite resistance protein n=1 Tax=Pseudooceanicola sp. LIPI14-2-Ac024 TaxID=3344875 RepID=UPI0035CE9781
MSIWTRIAEALAALANGEGLAAVFDKLRGPRERGAVFAIAVIALGAKMAKADGVVDRTEVRAFREVFRIPPEDEKNAAKIFNFARQDVAGFEEYAERVARALKDQPGMLCNLLEGLFYIAMADGAYHPDEDAFLRRVAEIFGLSEAQFNHLRARFVPDGERDPYEVLGVDRSAPTEDIRRAYRRAVRDSHPDLLVSQGLPEEAIKMAENRMVDLNKAWEEIQALRGAAA